MGSVSSADYLLFNAPIGYTKNPLTNTQAFQEKGKGSRSSTPMLKSLLSIPPSKLTLDKLPFEIRSRISNELSQIDCLQLIRVCKSLYLSTVQRIYQNIKIDQNYSEFSDEYNFHESDSASQQFSCTYIKTPYNLKKFLLTHNNPKLIKSLLCINLPDSLNIYNAQFPDLLKAFLMTLNHLSKLVWIDKGFEYSFLQLIPNLSDLQTLSINITCFTSSWFDIHPTGKLKFPILKNLQIINFQANQALTLILDSSNFEFTTMSNLKISRLQNNDSLLLLVYPFDSLINDMGSSRTFKLSDINTISSIFTGRKFHHLSVLLLHDILVEPNETKIFIESVNLEILETLELSSISEYQLLVTNFNSVNDLKQSFLINIAHRLVNLKHLLIDYRESHRDSVPEFLMLLPKKSSLKTLDLTIRYNRSKLSSYQSESILYEEYALAITSNNRLNTLTKLSIDLKEENSYCGDISISLPLPMVFYNKINQCQNLKSLRFSPSNHNEIINMIEMLKKLQYLDVFGTNAGGAPHLGLEMVNPTFFDEWFKVQHIAMLYTRCNMNLKYVRVNKCVFENLGIEVCPRDGLNRWFDQIIRMGVD